MTYKQLILKNNIKFSAECIDARPDGLMDMPAGSSHYRCRIRHGRNSFTVYFSQGPAIYKEPTAEDVLDCLASDAASFENAQGFEDWASEFGYDTDSRKAEKTYKAIEHQARELERVLGRSIYETLLFDTERL